jgi:hypothetical protein
MIFLNFPDEILDINEAISKKFKTKQFFIEKNHDEILMLRLLLIEMTKNPKNLD